MTDTFKPGRDVCQCTRRNLYVSCVIPNMECHVAAELTMGGEARAHK